MGGSARNGHAAVQVDRDTFGAFTALPLPITFTGAVGVVAHGEGDAIGVCGHAVEADVCA